MWPPFNEQKAGFVLERVIDSLKQKKISLSRSSSLSDGRNISQVMLGCLVGNVLPFLELHAGWKGVKILSNVLLPPKTSKKLWSKTTGKFMN